MDELEAQSIKFLDHNVCWLSKRPVSFGPRILRKAKSNGEISLA